MLLEVTLVAVVGGLGVVNIDILYSGIDHLPTLGEEVFSRHFGLYLGGGMPATLVNLRRLGVDARILTFLGDDFFSQFARREFRAAGAEVFNLYRGGQMPVVISSTMVCDGDRAFMSYSDRVEMTDEMLQDAYEHLKDADIVLMQPGFLPLYRALKADGRTMIFDTGWEDDLSLEKYGEYLDLADYYLPNRREALKITGADTPEGAAVILAQRLERPVIKLDRDGCMYLEDGSIHTVPPLPDVKVVDATGAGDAFFAGFAYGIAHGCALEKCIQFGNITGAACVQAPGCLTRYVTEAQLWDIRRAVYG